MTTARKARARLRPATARDLDWVVRRHAEHYADEYGYNRDFAATVAAIVRQYRRRGDKVHERGWIALHRGRPAGCVFVTRRSGTIGQLRLLLVEPSARGRGLGRQLVAECIAFARAVGYRKLLLWTSDELATARHLYEQAGFRQIDAERSPHFGSVRTMQFWALSLGPARAAPRGPA